MEQQHVRQADFVILVSNSQLAPNTCKDDAGSRIACSTISSLHWCAVQLLIITSWCTNTHKHDLVPFALSSQGDARSHAVTLRTDVLRPRQQCLCIKRTLAHIFMCLVSTTHKSVRRTACPTTAITCRVQPQQKILTLAFLSPQPLQLPA